MVLEIFRDELDLRVFPWIGFVIREKGDWDIKVKCLRNNALRVCRKQGSLFTQITFLTK